MGLLLSSPVLLRLEQERQLFTLATEPPAIRKAREKEIKRMMYAGTTLAAYNHCWFRRVWKQGSTKNPISSETLILEYETNYLTKT